MKQAYKIAILVVLGAAFTVVYLFDKDVDPSTQNYKTSEIQNNATDARSNAPYQTAIKDAGLERKFLDAPTAAALTAAASSQSPGEAAFVQIQIAQVCEQVPPLNANKPRSESAIALNTFRRSFCPGYLSSLAVEQGNLLSLPADDAYQIAYGMSAELFDAVAQSKSDTTEIAIISKQLNDIMLSTNSRMEALLAAEALHQASFISPETLMFAKSNNWDLSQHDLGEAQLLSTKMKMCEKFGGCGANQLMTIKFCSEQSKCATGASAESTWRRTTASKVYNAARQLSSTRKQ